MAGVSVLVLTYNEEANLPACLESVRWSDDLHVVDSGSTDRSQEIAREFGAQVYLHPFKDFSDQRNWALRSARFAYDWVLVVDADESVPPELAEEIEAAVRQAPEGVVGFEMRRKVYFLGRWLKHAGQFDAFWFPRLFRHRTARYEDRRVNEYLLIDGEIRRLRDALIHDDRKPIEFLLQRFDRYATLEAEETMRLLRGGAKTGLAARLTGTAAERRRWLKQLHLRLPLRGTRKLLYLLLWRRGLLDGSAGVLFSSLMAAQEWMLSVKLAALKHGLPVRSAPADENT
ncbi:MAG: glycosyltransferase family 2 protein [Candidatus Acidiferrales bacterium]